MTNNDSYDGRMCAEMLNRVSEGHIIRAIDKLLDGYTEHLFHESTHYDVVISNNLRLPPKAVFGVAASDALKMKVKPENFRGGEGEICFRAIRTAGFEIVRKGQAHPILRLPETPTDTFLVEGNQKFVAHLVRERKSSLSRAKKHAFRQEKGKLYCERCELDPEAKYGQEAGDACIEVHHIIPLADSQTVVETRLEDLECLCANCHRVTHWEMRNS